MDLDRDDLCKTYDEHEIFSALDAEDGGAISTQFAMIIDGSGSISPDSWDLMLDGIYDAVINNMPHDGSVEFTVVQFADTILNDARVEVGPTIITEANYQSIANLVSAITHMYEFTPLAAGINVATNALLPTASQYTRHIVNIVTDGAPNVPSGTAYTAAVNAIANMVSTLGFDPDFDEIDVEAIAISPSDFTWMRDNIVWPQPGEDNWPPMKPGWIRSVSNYQEFSDTIAEKFDIIFINYAPRVAYEFDANDGTGLYINSIVPPAPPTYPPTADACVGLECAYSGNCEDPVIFDGSDSHDNDESNSYIVTYQWDFGDGAVGTGVTPQHIYTSEGTYTVTLTVTDDEGETDTDTTIVNIICNGEPPNGDEAKVIMEDVNIDCGYGTSYTYLNAEDVTEEVGSGSFSICYNSDEITIVSVDQSEFDNLLWSTFDGTLSLTGIMGSSSHLTGDFVIARIGFVRVQEAETGCDLTICDSNLLTNDPAPAVIYHTTIDGYANIDCDNPSDGDMNGDGFINSGDVRYLAIYVASGGNDPLYSPLLADGDVNNDFKLNSGDVRYLAIYVASGGMDPNYSPLYP